MPIEDAGMLVKLLPSTNDKPSLEQRLSTEANSKVQRLHNMSRVTADWQHCTKTTEREQVYQTILPPHSPQGGIRFGRRNKFLCLFQHTIDLVLSDPHVFQMQHADYYGSAIHTWRCCG